VESTSRTDEKTSSDSTTDSNHLHVSVLQMTLKLAFTELFIARDFDGCFVFDLVFMGWRFRHGGYSMGHQIAAE
jgi:hypothetical protein